MTPEERGEMRREEGREGKKRRGEKRDRGEAEGEEERKEPVSDWIHSEIF